MKRILIFFAIFTACLAAGAQTVLKITDQGGQETYFGNVKDLKMKKTQDGKDSVSFKTMQVLRKDKSTGDTVYCPISYLAKKVEIINETPIKLNKDGIKIQLGLWAERFSPDMDDNRDLRATVKREKLYATYENGDTVKGMTWVSSDPTGVVVSADGEVHGYKDRGEGTYTIYGYSPGGMCDSCAVWVAANTSKYNEDSDIDAHSFKTNDDDLKYFPWYVTEIGVYNKSKADKKSTTENTMFGKYNDYFLNEQDMNDGAGGDYIYVGLKYDKNGEFITNPEDHYITDVKAIYTNIAYDPGTVVKIDGRNYQISKSLSDNSNVDLTAGTGGRVNIYLAYTKDPYPRKDALDKDFPNQKYLVSHTPDALLGGNGFGRGGWRCYTTNYFTNCTRIANGDNYGGDIDYLDRNPLNLGIDDEVVKAIDMSDKNYGNQNCDFNRGAGGDDIYMVCSYDEVYPPLDEWMKYVDDRTLVSKLSLPATHDSGTESIPTSNQAKTNARAQDLDIEEQFKMGIRSFDIRICDVGDRSRKSEPVLTISHGPIWSDIHYYDVLNSVKKMINEHPSEFIILRAKIENDQIIKITGKDPGKLFGTVPERQVMQKAIEREDEILGNLIIPFKKGMTLGECRGRVLVFNSDTGPDYPLSRNIISNISDDSFGGSNFKEVLDGVSIITSQNYSDNSLKTLEGEELKQKEELWSSEQAEIHWFDKGGNWQKIIKNKFWRQSVFMSEFSKLPATDHRWMAMNMNGFLWAQNRDTDGGFLYANGLWRCMFIVNQAQYSNTRMADYISGFNGRPCGMVQMDFAGLNEACQDHDSNCKWCGIVNGYKLTQAVVRNNFKNKTFINGQYWNSSYGTYENYVKVRDITFDKHSLTLGQGEKDTLTVSYTPFFTNNKIVIWSSSCSTIADVDENGKVTGVTEGNCIVYATSTSNPEAKDSCFVKVYPTKGYAHTGDDKIRECKWEQLWHGGPRFATTDLGATWVYDNMGTFKNDNLGKNYAWGDYIPSTAENPHESVNKLEKTLTSDNDPVTQLWGPCWRMMTMEEANELCTTDKVTKEEVTKNGVKGIVVSGKGDYSGRSIFLPQGHYWVNGYYGNNTSPCISTEGPSLYFSRNFRKNQYFVRPVNVCEDIPITDIEFNIPESTIPIGGTMKIEMNVIPSNTSYSKKLSISSSAEFKDNSDGSVTGMKEGTGVVTVYPIENNGLIRQCTVNVVNAIKIDDNQTFVQLWKDGPLYMKTYFVNKSYGARAYYGWGGDKNYNGQHYDGADPVIYYDNDPITNDQHSFWRMMTSTEAEALIDNCEWSFNDEDGYVISGKGAWKSQYILFPVTGKVSFDDNDKSIHTTAYTIADENGDSLYNYSAYWLSDTHQALVLSTNKTGKAITKKIKTLDPSTVCCMKPIYCQGNQVESVNLHAGDIKNSDGDVVYVDTIHIFVGDSCRMNHAIVLPENALTKRLKWTVKNPSIAKVSPILNTDTYAMVYGIKPGETVLTARSTDKKFYVSDSIVVVVEDYDESVKIREVKLDKDKLTVEIDDTKSLSVSFTPSDSPLKGVQWTSSDKTIASVSQYGTVTGHSEGTCYIYATSYINPEAKDSCLVTVPPISGIANTGEEEIGQCHWVQLWKNGPRIATTDLGASSEYYNSDTFEDSNFGQKYTWGDYIPSTVMNPHESANKSLRTLTSDKDPVTHLWGSCWRMMTPNEATKLCNPDIVTIEKTTTTNGVEGFKITGKGSYSCNSIFLPIGSYWVNYTDTFLTLDYGRVIVSNKDQLTTSISQKSSMFFVRPVYVSE